MQDFARSVEREKQRRQKKTSKTRKLPWGLAGITLAACLALGAGIYHLNGVKPDSAQPQASPKAQSHRDAQKDAPQVVELSESSVENRFDFYTLLPDSEVVAPKVSSYQSETTNKTDYLLQAGSFRNFKDADRLRAKLTLEGLDTSIKTATGQNGTWHRVLVGPLSSRSALNRAQDVLAQNNTESLLLRVKP